VNSNDFTRAFDRIREENSTYHVLGYYPTNDGVTADSGESRCA
jgi:hypothetical protein